MFGSEEFAEYVDTNFVDFAAILLDGVNYAYFNNEPSQVLSIRSESIGNYSRTLTPTKKSQLMRTSSRDEANSLSNTMVSLHHSTSTSI